ncbi:MAG: MotA/TolQ/ExbB proton channel family protein [Chlamydiota bacterium]|nr:MotA/TolQ/ExbB proton channel family protein [Chlamydiota bacterium]
MIKVLTMGAGVFQHIGVIGWLVILVLIFLSVMLWAILLNKVRVLKTMEYWSKQFIDKYRSEKGDILSIYDKTFKNMNVPSPLLKVYRAGCHELDALLSLPRQDQTGYISVIEYESLQKLFDRVTSEEIMELEHSLSVLATTASVSPLLGLFGTVWGIMKSFLGMTAKGSASIGAVAPGVATALLTTVIGLVVAIPALIAYNVLQNRINVLESKTNNFSSEFLSQIQLHYVRR